MSTINFVAKAPTGLEVEELTQKDILKCLRAKVSFEEAMRNVQAPRDTFKAACLGEDPLKTCSVSPLLFLNT